MVIKVKSLNFYITRILLRQVGYTQLLTTAISPLNSQWVQRGHRHIYLTFCNFVKIGLSAPLYDG